MYFSSCGYVLFFLWTYSFSPFRSLYNIITIIITSQDRAKWINEKYFNDNFWTSYKAIPNCRIFYLYYKVILILNVQKNVQGSFSVRRSPKNPFGVSWTPLVFWQILTIGEGLFKNFHLRTFKFQPGCPFGVLHFFRLCSNEGLDLDSFSLSLEYWKASSRIVGVYHPYYLTFFSYDIGLDLDESILDRP